MNKQSTYEAPDQRMKDATLSSLEDNFEVYQDGIKKLGVVLDELVKMLDLDGTGVDVYLLHYVVDAREALRSVIQILDTGCSKEVKQG